MEQTLGLSPAVLERIRAVFISFSCVEDAVVYGSRAKGNHKKGSDIDIAIRGSGMTLQDLNKIADALDDLLLPYTFDLALYGHVKNRDLIDHIDRVGKILYRRSPESCELPITSHPARTASAASRTGFDAQRQQPPRE